MRRGFTLVEMVVVLVLLVAVFAIATPLVVSRVRGAAFLEGQERLEAMAMLARADAQRRGQGVRVCVRGGVLFEEAVPVSSDLRAALGTYPPISTAEGATNAKPGARSDNSNELARLRVIGEMELPDGVAVFETIEAAREASAAGGASAAGAAGKPPEEVVIGVALPDGQFESAGARYLVGPDGRIARVEVSRWTGTVTATPVKLQDEDEEAGAEETTTAAPPREGV